MAQGKLSLQRGPAYARASAPLTLVFPTLPASYLRPPPCTPSPTCQLHDIADVPGMVRDVTLFVPHTANGQYKTVFLEGMAP